MINSQRKGKGYERHIAKVLSDAFDTIIRRTPNSGGLSIKGDMLNLHGDLEDSVIECKKQEKLNIWKCLEQTFRQARNKIGLLIFSRNNEGRDYACMDLQDYIGKLQEIKELRKLLEVAVCPNKDCVLGGYYDSNGNPCECQFCAERKQMLGD
jgi:Holliday junction resolvase